MRIYYSAKTGGFYDSRIHGERTKFVSDPEWIRPLITVILKPGEALHDGSYINETSDNINVDVPDINAQPEMLEVHNDACLLPEDAIEITAELHTKLLAGNAQGQLIVSDENGIPALQVAPAPTSEQLADHAIALRAQLQQTATAAIAPLQDAVDLEEATEAERTALTAWKRYRILLNRMELQDGYPHSIEWPVRPDEIAA